MTVLSVTWSFRGGSYAKPDSQWKPQAIVRDWVKHISILSWPGKPPAAGFSTAYKHFLWIDLMSYLLCRKTAPEMGTVATNNGITWVMALIASFYHAVVLSLLICFDIHCWKQRDEGNSMMWLIHITGPLEQVMLLCCPVSSWLGFRQLKKTLIA